MWLITNQWSSLELATRGVNVIFTISSAFSFLKAPKAVKINSLLPRIDIEIDKYLAQNFIVINF